MSIVHPIDVELNFSSPHINVCILRTQERPSENERGLGVDFHVKDDKINRDKELPYFHQNILGNPHGITNRLVLQLQTYGSRGKCMMVKFIKNYLWHDVVAFSQIAKSVLKVLSSDGACNGGASWFLLLL